MGYHKPDGGYADTEEINMASGVLSATQNGTSFVTGHRTALRLTLAVTAASASPTLDVAIETSRDGTTWAAVAAFTQATGVTSQAKVFGPLDRYVRAKETLGGTGTVTRTITGELV